jgi:hypothetical protein
MSFYTLRFTDDTKIPFIVNSNTANGPIEPDSLILHPDATAANTTLVILGRGFTDYGEPIQQNLVYLLENFADDTPPNYAVQGQLWYNNATPGLSVYNGTSWLPIVISGAFSGNLDMAGFKIVNLGNATLPTDALNQVSADLLYVNVTGDTMTGSLTLTGGASQVVLPNAPTVGSHATNKTYVDGTISASIAAFGVTIDPIYVNVSGDTMTGSLTIGSGDLTISTGNVIIPTGNIMMTAGGLSSTSGNITLTNGTLTLATGNITVTSGNLLVNGGSATFNGVTQHNAPVFVTNTSLNVTGVAGIINMDDGASGRNRIINLGTPLAPFDAATKDYVDTAIGISGADGVVYAGNINGTTGVITLNRTLALPDVVLSGAAAPFSHTHQSSAVYHNVDPAYDQSLLREVFVGTGTYPSTTTMEQVIGELDQVVFRMGRGLGRQVFVSDGIQTVYTIAGEFITTSDRLQVYVDGVKHVASFFAIGGIGVSPSINIGSNTGLASATAYRINLTVDSVLYTNVEITTGTAPILYYDLVNLLDAALVSLTIPATVGFDGGVVTIASLSAGAGSNITVSPPSAGTNLLTSLTGTVTTFTSIITDDYSYEETGIPYQVSSTFTFNVAPPLSSVIEVLAIPQ